jgi:two-component system, LuxR family, sensor kinase FixL
MSPPCFCCHLRVANPEERNAAMTSTGEHQAKVALLAAIVESSNDAIIAKDLTGVISSWNRAAERLFGYTAQEIIGQPITTIFPPDRVDEETVLLERIRHGETVEHYETTRRRKDGEIISVSVTISPVRDASGAIVGASKILHDLTDRNAHEQRIQELQAELAHVQRLTELGQVVSTLVHEVNQPLTAIGNYVNACRRLLTTQNHEQVPAALERIADQTSRTREIVARIRDFVKKRDVQMRAESLPQVIEEAIDLTRASARGTELTLTVQVDPTGTQAEIDKVQVQQVLFNLLRNGIEAMQGQSRCQLIVATKLTQRAMVEISVADTGPGLADEVRSNLFQPFVTTKPNGMGVGLSVCRAIVESHGGRLWADDNPGGGTIFRFTVRRADVQSPDPGPGRHNRITPDG